MANNNEQISVKACLLNIFDLQADGKNGTLSCTTSKLQFFPISQDEKPTRGIRDSNEIFLSSISHIVMNSLSKKNTKSIKSSSENIPTVKDFEIHCYDFSAHCFTFIGEKLDSSNSNSAFIDFLIKCAFSPSLDKHVAWSQLRMNLTKKDSTRTTQCQSRLSCEENPDLTRLSSCNKNFHLFHSDRDYSALPPYFLVPKNCDDTFINMFFECYENCYGPVISCCLPQIKTILMRSAMPIKETPEFGNYFDEFKNYVTVSTQPENNFIVKYLDKQNALPDIEEVQKSREELQSLCQCTSSVEFLKSDKHWTLELEKTRWLEIVSKTLQMTKEVVTALTDDKSSVLLSEVGGRDWTCVISSLVQISLFPECRRQEGFENLIQREWILMGHPFPYRCGHVHAIGSAAKSSESVKSAMFSLFIDCVFQIMTQHLLQFDFSQDYLVFLMDATHKPLFIEFSFNCEQERSRAMSGIFRSVWNWSDHLSSPLMPLLVNPAYKIKKFLSKQTTNQEDDPDPVRILKFSHFISMLQLWRHAYLRWMPFTLIRNGGYPITVICERKLLFNLNKECRTDYEEEMDGRNCSSLDHELDRRRIVSGYPFVSHADCATNLIGSIPLSASYGSSLDLLTRPDD